eukprot:scaffold93805_cov40-Prasinocladus_malaysianus.AAC.1
MPTNYPSSGKGPGKMTAGMDCESRVRPIVVGRLRPMWPKEKAANLPVLVDINKHENVVKIEPARDPNQPEAPRSRAVK